MRMRPNEFRNSGRRRINFAGFGHVDEPSSGTVKGEAAVEDVEENGGNDDDGQWWNLDLSTANEYVHFRRTEMETI